MHLDYSFRNAETDKDFTKIGQYLHPLAAGYPKFRTWVYERVIPELKVGYKQAFLGLSEDQIVASLIFQPHKEFPNVFIELKNLRIHPKVKGRFFGSFLLRQVETLSKEEGYQAIVCDTRSNNFPVIELLHFNGYQSIARAPLYEENIEDIIFAKDLGEGSKLFTSFKKNIYQKAF